MRCRAAAPTAMICAVAAAQENMDEAAKQEILEDEFCAAVGNKLNEYRC